MKIYRILCKDYNYVIITYENLDKNLREFDLNSMIIFFLILFIKIF